jgi:hypothetical protein
MTAALVPADPYAILGVTATASDDDLDHAFRGLVRQLHPDTRTPSEPDPESGADADRRLQEILTAYATLRNPISRAAYDRTRPQPQKSTNRSGPPPQLRITHPQTPSPIRVGPLIRVGPVRWAPPAQTTPTAAGDVAGPRSTTGAHDGT